MKIEPSESEQHYCIVKHVCDETIHWCMYTAIKAKKSNWCTIAECFLYSTVIYGTYSILVHLCEVDGKVPFKSSSVVLIIEIGKVSSCKKKVFKSNPVFR